MQRLLIFSPSRTKSVAVNHLVCVNNIWSGDLRDRWTSESCWMHEWFNQELTARAPSATALSNTSNSDMFNLQFWLKKKKEKSDIHSRKVLTWLKKEPLLVISTKKQTFLLIIWTGKRNFLMFYLLSRGVPFVLNSGLSAVLIIYPYSVMSLNTSAILTANSACTWRSACDLGDIGSMGC